jgi:hypothetical protein
MNIIWMCTSLLMASRKEKKKKFDQKEKEKRTY